ncbi:MAG: hypothetical protein DGJ47_000381 [Rickettsiaceae bacterium]
MSNKDKKLTPEQLQKIQQLQAMMMQAQGQGKGNPQAGGAPNPMMSGPKPPLAKRIFIGILQKMSECVKFVDQFIDLIVKKDGGDANDVVKSARAPILFGTFVTIFFAVFGTLWAATAPLDSAAVAIGTVVSQSQKKVVNHQEGGVIKEILIEVGSKVKKNDKLIILDDTRIKARYKSTLNHYRSLAATEARLLAHINNEEKVDFPEFLLQNSSDPAIATILETQRNLFLSKKEYFKSEKSSIEQRIKQSEKAIEGRKAKTVSLEKNLEVTKDRLEATKKLHEKGYAQKAVLLELESKEANIVSEIAVNQADIISSEQETTRLNIELINLDNRYVAELSTELSRTQIDLANAKEEYLSLEDTLNKIVIRAPVDGVINNLYYSSVGVNIPSSHNILEISPLNDSLVIDAKIPPKNIDAIKVGLRSKIRFSAFKSRTSPVFFGEIVSLSPDIIIDSQGQQLGQLANAPIMGQDPTAAGYYKARIKLDMDHFNELAKPRHLSLVAGMQAEVQIITGTRTMLQYLLDPVYDAMFKGFKER